MSEQSALDLSRCLILQFNKNAELETIKIRHPQIDQKSFRDAKRGVHFSWSAVVCSLRGYPESP